MSAAPAPDSPTPERPRRLRRALAFARAAFTAGDRVVAAVALVVVAYYIVQPGIFQGKASGDGWFGFMYLPGLLYHGTFDLAPTAPQYAQILGHEVTGRVANACPIGPDLFWLPTYLVGRALHGIASLVVHLPPEGRLPGQSPFDFWMAALGALAAGLAGVALQFRLLARHLSRGAARFATVATVLATPLVWYLAVQPLYQHACAYFVCTALVERWDAWRGQMSRRRVILLGLLGGAAMDMRLQEAVFLFLPGLDLLERAARAAIARRGRDLGAAILDGALLGAAALVAFLPQLAVWIYFFGHVRPPQPPGHMRWLDPALVAMLFSIRGGLLPWTPIYYLVLPGLLLGRKRLGGLGARAALLLAVMVWVNASAWDHFGSFTFGARRFVEVTAFFALALGGLWDAASKSWMKRALVVVAALAIVWNGLLMELVRRGKIRSSGAMAAPASQWVRAAKGPEWLARTFDKIGYPFCQPAGWIFAAVYHVPVTTFEGTVGTYILERDSRIHSVYNRPAIELADPGMLVPDGIAGPPDPKTRLVPVGKRVRLLVPLFAREPLRLEVEGDFGGREAAARISWNGAPLAPLQVRRGIISLLVPAERVHTRAWTNELVVEPPDGTRLLRARFGSTTVWY